MLPEKQRDGSGIRRLLNSVRTYTKIEFFEGEQKFGFIIPFGETGFGFGEMAFVVDKETGEAKFDNEEMRMDTCLTLLRRVVGATVTVPREEPAEAPAEAPQGLLAGRPPETAGAPTRDTEKDLAAMREKGGTDRGFTTVEEFNDRLASVAGTSPETPTDAELLDALAELRAYVGRVSPSRLRYIDVIEAARSVTPSAGQVDTDSFTPEEAEYLCRADLPMPLTEAEFKVAKSAARKLDAIRRRASSQPG